MIFNKKGMTIIELVVVIFILGLLCVAVLPILYGNRDRTILKTAASTVKEHINHSISKAIGSSTGYGIFLDNDLDNRNLVTVLNFCSGMSNISGSTQLSTTSGTDSTATLSVPISPKILGKIYNEFPIGTLISFVGHPYEYGLGNDGTFCTFREDANQNCYNSTFPFNCDGPTNPYYFWTLSIPPRRSKGTKSLMGGNTCIDLGFSSIGIYGYSTSVVDIPEYPLTITFDDTGHGYTAVYNKSGVTKQRKINVGTPIALLTGFLDQVGENWIAEPTEDDPGWNIQRQDTYWVVFDPKSSRTFVIENYVKKYNSEPPLDIAIQDAQTFVRQTLTNQQ